MSASVFPARAGMSPTIRENTASSSGVPRASGDEPACPHITGTTHRCSPRERG